MGLSFASLKDDMRLRIKLLLALSFVALAAQAADDTAVITIAITRRDGQSIRNVEVSVDRVTRMTDANGMARFVVKPGQRFLHLSSGQEVTTFIAAGQKIRWNVDYYLCVCERVTGTLIAVDADDAPIDTPLMPLRDLPLARDIGDVARLAPGTDPAHGFERNDALFIGGIHGDDLQYGYPAMGLPTDFFLGANVISGAMPAEFGHASGDLILATPRRFGAGLEAFAYAQPTTRSEHDGLRTERQQWDAGLMFGNRWLFAAYDRASHHVRQGFGGDYSARPHTTIDAFLVRAESQPATGLSLIGEVAGDPATTEYGDSFLSMRSGIIAESVEALALVNGTTIDAAVSHREQRTLGTPHTRGNRAHLDLARNFGPHLLRAGVEREQMREHVVDESHSGYTAAYVTDMWQIGTHLTANAGIRAEAVASTAGGTTEPRWRHFSDHTISPRGSLIWLGNDGLRVFGTYAKWADDLPLAYIGTIIIPPGVAEETTAGIEKTGYGFGGGVRLVHRGHENEALLTSTILTTSGTNLRASYVFSDSRRRHNFIGEGSTRIGWNVTTGAIVQWARGYFSADVHGGVKIAKTELVVDVFNAFGNQSVLDTPFAGPRLWQSPRAIRFGVRTAL